MLAKVENEHGDVELVLPLNTEDSGMSDRGARLTVIPGNGGWVLGRRAVVLRNLAASIARGY